MTNKINDLDDDADEECDNEEGEESSTDVCVFIPSPVRVSTVR